MANEPPQSVSHSDSVARPVRSLKIEEDGDPYRGNVKPKIRIRGNWLEEAGFKPGGRVRVTYIAPGIMELRSQVSDSREPP